MEDPYPGWALLLNAGSGPLEIVALCLSLAVVVWAVIAQSAIRNARWSRLEKLVGDQPRLDTLEEALKDEEDLLDSLLVLRLIASIVAVLLIVGGMSVDGDPSLVADPWSFLGELGVLVLVFIVGVHGIVRGIVRAAPERFLLAVLPTVKLADRVFMPLRLLVGSFSKAVERMMGIREPKEEDEAREEILDAVSEGEREGAIGDDEREMIESIIEFKDMEVSEVMTPRTSVFGLSADTPVDDAVAVILEKGHSRVPVYGESIDDVLGILYAKDLLALWQHRNGSLPNVRDLLRKPLYVPETKSISELLRELRASKVHMAIVLDEYGGMSGLVTIEDILEEIVGEIEDEYDREDESEGEKVERISEREAEVSARIDMEELNNALAIHLPDEDSYETLGGFLFTQLGRVPAVGETHEFNNVKFEVIDADDRRINRVRVVVGT